MSIRNQSNVYTDRVNTCEIPFRSAYIHTRLVNTLGVSTYRDSQEVCRTMTDSTLEIDCSYLFEELRLVEKKKLPLNLLSKVEKNEYFKHGKFLTFYVNESE